MKSNAVLRRLTQRRVTKMLEEYDEDQLDGQQEQELNSLGGPRLEFSGIQRRPKRNRERMAERLRQYNGIMSQVFALTEAGPLSFCGSHPNKSYGGIQPYRGSAVPAG